MTTAETITLAVAVAGGLGIGSVLPALVTHRLGRRERTANIADKDAQVADRSVQSAGRSVEVMEAAMRRMETDLARALNALEKAERETELLRAQLQNTGLSGSPQFAQTMLNLQSVDAELIEARNNMDNMATVIGNVYYYIDEDNTGQIAHQRMTHEQRGAIRDKDDAWFQELLRTLDNPDGNGSSPHRQR